MKSALYRAVEVIRERASNDVESGTAFENLTKIFLEHDATQQQEYKQVWCYSDWAKGRKGYRRKDIGIDLVVELTDGYELEALKGGSSVLGEGKIKYIQFEFGENAILA